MRTALVLSLLIVSSACSSTLRTLGSGEQARYRHRELGYEIRVPGVLAEAGRSRVASESGWERASSDEADLLLRHRDGSAWALVSNCRGTRAGLPVLAAELSRAAGGGRQGPRVPVQLGAFEGLSQRLSAGPEARRLQIKTVTLRGALCTYDWILIAPSLRRYAELEAPFDAWWQSFVPGPNERPARPREPETSESSEPSAGVRAES